MPRRRGAFVYAGFGPPAPQGEALVVRNDSSYRTLADLRGRTIALNKGSNVHYLLLGVLQSNGMTLADVRCEYLPPDEALLRIESGRIDAWAIWDPILTAAQMEHDLRILFDGRGLTQNVQFHLFSTQFTRRHAAILAKPLNEGRRLERYVEAHPAEIAETMAHEMGLRARKSPCGTPSGGRDCSRIEGGGVPAPSDRQHATRNGMRFAYQIV